MRANSTHQPVAVCAPAWPMRLIKFTFLTEGGGVVPAPQHATVSAGFSAPRHPITVCRTRANRRTDITKHTRKGLRTTAAPETSAESVRFRV